MTYRPFNARSAPCLGGFKSLPIWEALTGIGGKFLPVQNGNKGSAPRLWGGATLSSAPGGTLRNPFESLTTAA